MGRDKVCSFFGHRDIRVTDALKERITEEIEKTIEFGCGTFYFGGYGDFDRLCYDIVTQIKRNNFCEIKRVYCVSQERYLYKNVRYFNRADYDEVKYIVPAFSGWYKSIYYRNCAMISESDYVIFYAENRENSGAYKAYNYAKRQKEKTVVNLWY